jgi:hypothetical protein
VPNTIDLQPSEKIQAGIFGGPGTGKTHLALTFPRPNVLDFDKGILTSRSAHFVNSFGRSLSTSAALQLLTTPMTMLVDTSTSG